MTTIQEEIFRYAELSSPEIDRRISEAKNILGSDLLILGHHYMRDEVIKFSDFRGDSFRLSQQAAESQAKYIVFCGVYFMAETADILTADNQTVLIPDPEAGCVMADMADIDQVEECWETLQQEYPGEILPVSYINSSAELKAFCGKNGGLICTSSSAPAALKWVIRQGKRILFFPDEHLGRNTAFKMGITPEKIAVWNRVQGELSNNNDPNIILWNGFCPVHLRFSGKHINALKEKYPDIKIIVHPECSNELVKQADDYGSTEYIAKIISEAPAGSRWAVGTEINMVKRLAHQHPDKLVIPLTDSTRPCVNMFKIGRENLLCCLDNLTQGKIINQVKVPSGTAEDAKIALQRMLSI